MDLRIARESTIDWKRYGAHFDNFVMTWLTPLLFHFRALRDYEENFKDYLSFKKDDVLNVQDTRVIIDGSPPHRYCWKAFKELPSGEHASGYIPRQIRLEILWKKK